MERYDIDAEAAFRLLVRASQQMNVKLRVLAQQVVSTLTEPWREPCSAARRLIFQPPSLGAGVAGLPPSRAAAIPPSPRIKRGASGVDVAVLTLR
jgi:hypothetical protein